MSARGKDVVDRRARALAILAVLALVPPAGAVDRAEWLREHTVALRSIDPVDEDFADLAPLRSILANRRVVILGETSHGDGSTFLAKTRLIRFLHRELDFDVLAFESGFYDCWKAWRRFATGEDATVGLRQAVFSVWTRSAQLQPLLDYVAAAARSSRPLELAGVDPQFTGEMSKLYLRDDLLRLAEAVGWHGDELAATVTAPLANLVHGRYELGEKPAAAERRGFLAALDELARRVAESSPPPEDRDRWLRFLRSTGELASASWARDWDRPPLEDPASFAHRDRLMGEQLAWLARHPFAGRKIVVWAASFHAARNVHTLEVPSAIHTELFRTLQPMGAVARRELGDELYTVAVLAYAGEYGSVFAPRRTLLRPTDGSLEDLFHRAGITAAFLDLTRPDLPRWLRSPVIARPLGYKEMRARWRDVFDGLLFIDRVESSHLVP